MAPDPDTLLAKNPIIAILRGIRPDEILNVAQILVDQGIKVIEVPLNSPDPYDSIKLLCDNFGSTCLCGAGTVVTAEQVDKVQQMGGQLIVSPNVDTAVIKRTIELGMVSVPGFSTPSEAYQAYHSGTTLLKMFPAANIGLDYFKSISTIMPKDAKVIATGGINPENICSWLSAGAIGLGIGGDLYKPGISLDELRKKAESFNTAIVLNKKAGEPT
ncbi:MAG: 2-dehydro-3-deoxy-6-phosphogalactonate aldolase [Pseudomonadales bacterium]